MAEPVQRPAARLAGTVTAAAVLLAVKALLGIWAAVVLLSATRRHHRRFVGVVVREHHPALGVVLFVFVAATVAVVIGLLAAHRWARIGAFVLEGLAIVLALTRIGSRPGAALLSIALSVAIIGLLATRSAADALSS